MLYTLISMNKGIKTKPISWLLSSVWNKSLDTDRTREIVPRMHIWASELGGSYYDRYFKMKAREPLTGPDTRARRKFEAGNLTEWVVKQILVRAGILQSSQNYITYDRELRVTGRCDFIAGGYPSPVTLNDLPETLAMVANQALELLYNADGLATQILEIKSCSAAMFARYEQGPGIHHALQAFHYAYNLKLPAHLVYVCRDDLRMVEWIISPSSRKWKKLYDQDIAQMAAVIETYDKAKEELTEEEFNEVITELKEPLLVWNKKERRFNKNYRVEYSLYLPDYGFKQPGEYADITRSLVGRLNRVIKRIDEGKKLTDLNIRALQDAVAFWPGVKEIIYGRVDKTVG
jgi:hypothetical protein